jgi:hypothetical protein
MLTSRSADAAPACSDRRSADRASASPGRVGHPHPRPRHRGLLARKRARRTP